MSNSLRDALLSEILKVNPNYVLLHQETDYWSSCVNFILKNQTVDDPLLIISQYYWYQHALFGISPKVAQDNKIQYVTAGMTFITKSELVRLLEYKSSIGILTQISEISPIRNLPNCFSAIILAVDNMKPF